MKFKKEMLQELVYDDCLLAEKIEDNITGTTRWSILHEMIFKYNDKFYIVQYSIGATEMQEERPFEYSADEIECPEVEQKEVKVKKWILLENETNISI